MPRKAESRKKRRNGDGSEWYDAARGLYFATYTRGLKPDGVPYVKRFSSTASQAEANRKRDEDRGRWRRNVDTPAWMEIQTVGQFLRRRWFATRKASDETLRRWEAAIRLHVDPDPPKETSIGHLLLRRLQHTDLARLYDALPPSVAASVHQMLHVAFRRAKQWGDVVADSPADLVDAPTYSAPELHPPSEEQIIAFFAKAEEVGDPQLDLWYWLADTGCRPGEMLGVEWADVDSKGEWFVQRQRSTTSPPVKKEIKNRQRRRVQLTERLRERLRERRKQQLAQVALAGDAWQDLNLVFANRFGGPLHWSNVVPAFKGALESAGLRKVVDGEVVADFSPYVFFRHAHVTIGLANDVAIQDMSKRTGHTVEVLARVYAHRVARRDQDAARRFEQATTRR